MPHQRHSWALKQHSQWTIKTTTSEVNSMSQTDNTIDLGKPMQYPINGELCTRLSAIIEEYEGRVSTAEVIGFLEMLKISIFDEAFRADQNNEK